MSAPPFTILVIPGDGIGREVIPAAVAVLQATNLPLQFVEADAGWDCFQRCGDALPHETLDAARAADAVLFGAVASPSYPVAGYRSPIVRLRRELDLYANIRPVFDDPPPGDPRARRVDLAVVRENTEGLYAGRERVEDGGATAIAERVITRRASERIARVAFELARARRAARRADDAPPGRVTIVHKANVLRETCGLFRTIALDVAQAYPDVQADEMLVDACALHLATRPERFDVIVTTNLFGDILSDVACAWGGGLGLAPSANLGERHALFEPVHGAAPDIAGKGIANPLAAIGCAALLLDHLASRASPDTASAIRAWSERIRRAVRHVRAVGPHTPDLGGDAATSETTAAVIAHMLTL
ncbi:isocitrate/isopropylmalate dehydrogenase family protein [Roseiflexus castenholzii]|uniref:Isocitrate/homoisocitrate dehydrogenase n=1 Tax=Roseiflexus castenholzii (strain DSM 13941 / HLO8) TaxID=383372 RepID=A7NPM5_ROSCS|nr:isocitrate/isopropylmalate dehydrogenase family protein [Roseiflexus castenholzii]ABU59521.1 3-isopropylmalate dehydrogenase [Roseiflexus castenholzii DSM 13941]